LTKVVMARSSDRLPLLSCRFSAGAADSALAEGAAVAGAAVGVLVCAASCDQGICIMAARINPITLFIPFPPVF
jgi:hypothetical protein